MADKRTLTIGQRGQVTLPKDWMQKNDLKPGDSLSVVETDEGFLMVSSAAAVAAALDKIGAALKDAGVTLDQLLEDGRKIRSDVLRDKYGIDVPPEDD